MRGTNKSHHGWLNIPIALGDAIVRPGDLVLGDSDGLLIVAIEELQTVAEKALSKRQQEIIKEDRLKSGESIKQVLGF